MIFVKIWVRVRVRVWVRVRVRVRVAISCIVFASLDDFQTRDYVFNCSCCIMRYSYSMLTLPSNMSQRIYSCTVRHRLRSMNRMNDSSYASCELKVVKFTAGKYLQLQYIVLFVAMMYCRVLNFIVYLGARHLFKSS